MKLQLPDGVVVTGEISQGASQILTHDALTLIAKVHREFNARRIELLKRREQRQSQLDAGKRAGFSAGNGRNSRRRLDGRTDSAGSAGSTSRDYRADRSEDDYQCA